MPLIKKVKVNGTLYDVNASSDYEDLDNIPMINGVELLGDKTAEQLGITSNVCNLGRFSDYSVTNRLDLDKLTPGIYFLYKNDAEILYLKATHNGDEVMGSWTAATSLPLILLRIISSTGVARGFLTYFYISTSASDVEIKYMPINITILGDRINVAGGMGASIKPVILSGAQTITGEKTFTTLPKSSIVPTDNTHFTNKAYVDSAISTAISQITDGDEVSY